MNNDAKKDKKFDPGLEIGEVISNERLMHIFKVQNSGGIRRSKTTDTLVIVADFTKGLYDDRWDGDVLHYTGQGRKGHQKLESGNNRTLYESPKTGIPIFLFEVVKEREYTYLGQALLYDEPYQEQQLDDERKMRNVWIFPLKIIQNQKTAEITNRLSEQKYNAKAKKAKRMSDEKLKERAILSGTEKVGVRNAKSKTYERNPYVAEYAKRRANGICELCEQPAPFKNKEGEPFLETHHIDWLARGGADTIENTVALCPNCHRKMHVVDAKEDVKKLKQIVK